MRARHTPNTEKLGDSPDFYYLFEDRTDEFNGWDREEDRDSRGEFDLHAVLGGLGGIDAQDCAGLGFSSEFRFPLVDERRPAVDRLAELRDREHWIVRTGRSVRPKSGPLSGMMSEAFVGSP